MELTPVNYKYFVLVIYCGIRGPEKISEEKIIRTIVFAIVGIFLLSALAPSQMSSEDYKAAISEKITTIPFTVTFSENDFVFDTIMGYDRVALTDGGYLTSIGKPMLPIRIIRIALPTDMKATTIQIINKQEQHLDGTYLLYPVQQPKPIGSPANSNLQIDAVAYQSPDIYPVQYVELIGETDLAGQAMAVITIYPLHYRANQKQLELVTSLEFVIEGVSGYVCGDYLPTHATETETHMFEQAVKEMVINPADVTVQHSQNPQQIGVGPGDYDYVIITTDSWVGPFQPLADWKTKKGIPATIVTTTWIYSTYGGSTNVDKIRAFVIDAYTNWGTTFFLIGGDTGYVPCHFRTFSYVDPDPVPNDTYYADYDADWAIEVNVGRASVVTTGSGAGGIQNFINKLLTYEKNPPLTDYAKKAAMFGFNLDGSTPAEQCKIQIDNSYIPASWTMTNVYDSQGGNHATNVIAAINAGQNLLNHADHSGSDFMGTGYVNHGWGLYNSNMDNLNNGNKQGILYSMGCDPAAYDSSNCIAEHYVRDTNGGGIAFIGNSRYGWYNPGYFNTLSMLYDQKFFYSLFTQNNYKLGITFSAHKNDYTPGSDQYYRYIWTELTLLGDPEVPVWKENPMSLAASYPSQLPIGSSPFTVHVTSEDNPLNQAYVCLWKGTEVYLTGLTNAAGDITFNPAPMTTGTMYVTVTKQNYLPYEGQATVTTSNQPPDTPNQPSGPMKGLEETAITYSTQTTDPENDEVYYMWDWGNEVGTWQGPYPSGSVAYAQHTWPVYGIYNLKVKAKDTIGAESGWSTPLQVRIYKLGDLNADNVVNFGDINPFVYALIQGETAYYIVYPDGYYYTGDCNRDGVVNFGDINPFVALLTGG